ncbi:MAG: sulfite exporter TauE/SafE family protein [Burkholderiales bacterium]
MNIPVEFHILAISALVVTAAYVIFGISAFGAALFTVPALSYLYPLDFVLPVCVLLDVSASIAIGTRFSREADKRELSWMAPASLVGAVLGVTLLVSLPRQATLVGLGALLLCYGVYMLRQGEVVTIVSRRWAPVSGFVGGAMGTLFGIGAPPYAIYLSRRLPDKGALRATLSNMVLLSTGIRALVFAVGGLILADRLIVFVILLPFALAGLWCGNRIHGRISREQVARVMSAVLILIGVSLLVRALAG